MVNSKQGYDKTKLLNLKKMANLKQSYDKTSSETKIKMLKKYLTLNQK